MYTAHTTVTVAPDELKLAMNYIQTSGLSATMGTH